MTAHVSRSFVARRGDQLRAERCPACARRADGECYQHRLEALELRVHLASRATEGSLLVPADQMAEVLADVLAVVGSITTPARAMEPPETTPKGARS